MTNKKLYVIAGFLSIVILVLSLFIVLSYMPKTEEKPSNTYDFSGVDLRVMVLDMRAGFSHMKPSYAPPVQLEGMVFNPLTGQYVDENRMHQRPIVVQFDNFYLARPQASLSLADVAFEILAEGNITRYMAVFYTHYPDVIGPIRSTRPYFVYKALEFDPYYVHVGGSVAGLQEVRKYQMADIDALSSAAFYRVSHKKMPHNTYSSSEMILKDANRRGYKSDSVFTFMPFYTLHSSIGGEPASHFQFVYKNPNRNDPTGYSTSYKYNSEEKLYYRYTNDKPHLDEATGLQLTCANVIVQYAPTKVIDKEGRLQVDFVGKGQGVFFSNGEMLLVNWVKNTQTETTQFFYEDGNPIRLNPGQTWIQVMPTGQAVTIHN